MYVSHIIGQRYVIVRGAFCKCFTPLTKFVKVIDEVMLCDGIVTDGDRIVLPVSLCGKIMELSL